MRVAVELPSTVDTQTGRSGCAGTEISRLTYRVRGQGTPRAWTPGDLIGTSGSGIPIDGGRRGRNSMVDRENWIKTRKDKMKTVAWMCKDFQDLLGSVKSLRYKIDGRRGITRHVRELRTVLTTLRRYRHERPDT